MARQEIVFCSYRVAGVWPFRLPRVAGYLLLSGTRTCSLRWLALVSVRAIAWVLTCGVIPPCYSSVLIVLMPPGSVLVLVVRCMALIVLIVVRSSLAMVLLGLKADVRVICVECLLPVREATAITFGLYLRALDRRVSVV